jgi:hypothetical protein
MGPFLELLVTLRHGSNQGTYLDGECGIFE